MRKQTLIIPTEEELEKITNPEGLQKRLANFQAKLIEMVSESQEVKETVFAQRIQIANILRKFGSEKDKNLADLLEELTSPDFSLSTNTPVKQKSKQHTESRSYQPPGYFVFGDHITDTQRQHMTSGSKYRKHGQKVGDPMYLDLASLFRISKDPTDPHYISWQERENRPIYINCELDSTTRKQLLALIRLRPELEQQIFIMTWSEDNKVTLTPLRESLTQTQKDEEDDSLTRKELKILNFALYHQPRLGEVYQGKITKITDFCLFLKILPKIEGMASYSDLPPPYNNRKYFEEHQDDFKIDDQLSVKIIGIEDDGFIHIKFQVLENGTQETTFETSFPDFFQERLIERQN